MGFSKRRVDGAKHVDPERGANLVEFAILAPLLIILLFGIIEFGWAIGQQVDLRSKAREAARIGMVGGTDTDVLARVCADDLVKAANVITIDRLGDDTPDGTITVNISIDIEEITGLFGPIWGPNPQAQTTTSGRVEQPADLSWANGTSLTCP